MHDQANPYQQIIAKCRADEAFKQRLLADPAGTLKQEGMEIPAGMTINVVENTDQELTFVISPSPMELSDEAIAGIAGGESAPGIPVIAPC